MPLGVPTANPFSSLSSVPSEDETGLFRYSFVNRHLGCFWLGSTMHTAAKNMLIHGFFLMGKCFYFSCYCYCQESVHINKCFLSTYNTSDVVLDTEVRDPGSELGL